MTAGSSSGTGKEILFLCHRIPFPPDRGDKIRSCHILKALSAVAPVHVGCFADDERDIGFAPALQEWSASQSVLLRDRSKMVAGMMGLLKRQPMLVALYDDRAMHNWVAQTLAERPIGAIFAYSAQMAHFVPDLSPDIRFVMDFVDFDSAKYAAYGVEQSGPMGWINRREGRKLFDFERRTAQRADMSLFVSEAEAALFHDATGMDDGRVRAIDNGVDLDFFDPNVKFLSLPLAQRHSGPLIVFTGQMDYRPNVDAVTHFAQEAMPAIRAVHSDATFAIVGRNPTPAVSALSALPGVQVTGAVDDVRIWLKAADVVVAPLRIARGVQNKVLEAMAMGRPVVASVDAAAGIDARDGEHLIVADTAAGQATAVLGLLADSARAAQLGQAARARMIARYEWSTTLAPLRTMLGPQFENAQ